MLSDEWLRLRKLLVHLLKFAEALREFAAGWRVLGACGNQLHCIQLRLLIEVEQQLNDLVQLVQVVYLNPAFFQLSE